MKIIRRSILFLTLFVVMCVPLHSGSIGSGRTACPASGTVALAQTQTSVAWVIVQAPAANAGIIYVGSSAVTSTTGPFILAGGTFMAPPRSNSNAYSLNNVFFACSNANDAVTYIYAQ